MGNAAGKRPDCLHFLRLLELGFKLYPIFIGPHAPALSPDDVQLVHRLWLNMRRDPSMQDLHHSDIITYALTHLAGQYAREKEEILRDLRNYRAAETPKSIHLGGHNLSRLPSAPDSPTPELPPQKPMRYI